MLPRPTNRESGERVLRTYLLGRVGFDEWLALQRRLAFDVACERSTGILVLCEHPAGISIGREGSSAHVHFEADELDAMGWPLHWVQRGGGCLLHLPGQVACYPIFALDELKLNVQDYLDRLHDIIRDVLRDFHVPAETRDQPGVWIGERRVAHVGVAISGWVSSFGCAINVNPPLKPFRRVDCDGDARSMTSLEREVRGRARPATVRQRLVELFSSRFGFERVALFHHHPSLSRKAPVHAVATAAR